MSSRATARKAIVEAAYARAQEEGVGSLSVRGIAADCGVSIGTIYNHFPDKAALVTEVISMFWERIALPSPGATCFSYSPGENLIGYCRRVAQTLGSALQRFREKWLVDLSSLDGRTLQSSHEAEKRCFAHVERGIAMAAHNDASIASSARDSLEANMLSHFIWTNMLASLKEGDQDCKVLFEILDRALYR